MTFLVQAKLKLSAPLSFDPRTGKSGRKEESVPPELLRGGKGMAAMESWATFSWLRRGSERVGNHTESRTHLPEPHERDARCTIPLHPRKRKSCSSFPE